VLCAGEPDTPELAKEFIGLVDELQASRDGVHWIQEMLPRAEVIQLLSDRPCSPARRCTSRRHREPGGDGLRNRRGGQRCGGIPDVVRNGVTGLLVPYSEADPRAFEDAFAERVNELLENPERARRWAWPAASGPWRSTAGAP